MNENPGGTPNPLNPSPAAGPAPEPVPTPAPGLVRPIPLVQSTPPRASTNPVAQPTQATPTSPVEPTVPAPESAMPAEPAATLSPADRPMEKAAPNEIKPKKKKTGLIAGIIAAVAVLLIGGIAAAVVMINMNQQNPVLAAINKIMAGNAPANVAIDGDINIAINDDSSPISNVKIALNSKMITSSAINNSVANVTATIRNVGDFNIEFDEVYAGNGDLYFKIDGATSALEDSGILYLLNLANQMPDVVDCGEDAVCQTTEIKELTCTEGEECNLTEINDTELNVLDGGQNVLDVDTISYFASLVDAVEVIDGEWLKVSVDELNMLSDGMTTDSNISCVTNLVSDINTNSNSAAELYSKYPFIISTNKDIEVASKNYPVYQVGIDSKKFADYVNSIQNPKMTANLYSCLGWTDNVNVSEDDVAEIVNEMPKIYVEVDGENNFTRLYLERYFYNDDDCYPCAEGETCGCPEPSGTMLTIDLGFSYPTNVNVPEIEEYRDFSEVLEEIFSSMYKLPSETAEVVIKTVDN